MNLNLLNILKDNKIASPGIDTCLIILLSLAITGLFGLITYLLIAFISEVCDGKEEIAVRAFYILPSILVGLLVWPIVWILKSMFKYYLKIKIKKAEKKGDIKEVERIKDVISKIDKV